MSIYYFSFTRFPSEKAHSLYLAKICEAFAKVGGINTSIVVPRRYGEIKENYKNFYDLDSNFCLIRLPVIDLFPLAVINRIALYIGLFSFSLSSVFYTLLKIQRRDILISNDALVSLMLTLVSNNVVYELHDYPGSKSWIYKQLFKRVRLIQTNNNQKQLLLKKDFFVPENKLYTAHNGVTIKDFDIEMTKADARKKLGWNLSSKIIVYTGHLYDWKGADVLAKAAVETPDKEFIFVGGTERDVDRMKQQFQGNKNLHFTGFKKHSEIPIYQKAADVLVVPNTAKKEISRLHTSPMKIFEYMASKTLIVASDIPSIREVLNKENSLLFRPDDINSLTQVIHSAFSISEENKKQLTEKAFADVKKHSWINRSKKILDDIFR